MDQQSSKPRQSSTSRTFWIGVLLVFAGMIFMRLLLGQFPSGGQTGVDHPAVGRTLPMLRLKQLGNPPQEVDLTDLEGKVALVNFWGTWCPPCLHELPHIAELHALYGDRDDFRLLAVSCPASARDESFGRLQSDTLDFLAARAISIPAYGDAGTTTRQGVQMALGGPLAYPTTLLLDRGNVIRGVWVGYRSGYELEMRQQIDELLKDSEESR